MRCSLGSSSGSTKQQTGILSSIRHQQDFGNLGASKSSLHTQSCLRCVNFMLASFLTSVLVGQRARVHVQQPSMLPRCAQNRFLLWGRASSRESRLGQALGGWGGAAIIHYGQVGFKRLLLLLLLYFNVPNVSMILQGPAQDRVFHRVQRRL